MRPQLLLVAIVSWFAAAPAVAAVAVTATPAAPMPTKAVTVSGSGFAASEPVDIYLDTVDSKLVFSDAAGAFSTSLTIPAGTDPGLHTVSAIGRRLTDGGQAGIVVTTPWRQYGFGAGHRGWNPFETALDTNNVGNLGEVWVNNSLVGNGSTPAFVYPNLYVTTQAGVAALNASTGAVLWKVLAGQLFYASPVVTNVVYVASYPGNVYALNPATGAIVWGRGVGGVIVSSPAVVGGIVYVGNFADNKLYALNASNGAILWRFTVGGGIASTPTVVNGIVYFGSESGILYALNAATGALIWSFSTGSSIESSPAVVNGTVFIGSNDSKVYALNAGNGFFVWAYTTNDRVVSTPAVAGATVYVGSEDGTMNALDIRTGLARWTLPVGSGVNSPSVANGVVYFTAGLDHFYATTTYGSVLFSGTPGRTSYGASTISDGVVYLNALSSNGNNRGISAFAPNAGAMARPKKPGQPKLSELHPDLSLVASK